MKEAITGRDMHILRREKIEGEAKMKYWKL